ncbi:MAG: hypothetical protein AAFU79_05445 [Myxococcota bacterium]
MPGTDRADSGGASDSGDEPAEAGVVDVGAADASGLDLGADDAGASCVPTGPEVCGNGVDDDCMNGIDCNDPACGACVRVPDAFSAGVLVEADEACPVGFISEVELFAELDPGKGCADRCSCRPNPTECLGELYIYSTRDQCRADTALTGGQRYTRPIDATCTMQPVAEGFPGGYRLGGWTVKQSCESGGTAAPSPFSWGRQAKFCVAERGTRACADDTVCVPRGSVGDACALASGGVSCPGPFSDRVVDWYTGESDTRACGACDCTASGGSCEFARLSLGSDWVCTDDSHLTFANPKLCESAYSPPARVTGSVTNPSCTPKSAQMGALRPTGQQTLCCRP